MALNLEEYRSGEDMNGFQYQHEGLSEGGQ